MRKINVYIPRSRYSVFCILCSALFAFSSCKDYFNIENPQRIVVVWSVALSEGASFAAVILQGWLTAKAYVLAAGAGVLIGLLVAYAAMYGYDELYKDVLSIFDKLLGYLTGKVQSNDQQPES